MRDSKPIHHAADSLATLGRAAKLLLVSGRAGEALERLEELLDAMGIYHDDIQPHIRPGKGGA